ncbi:hypothetical protein SmJEL517_g00476 [Synchytrium microbalum]|uniref:F-box domain-containing protein n=1 Tax=Synchytrium microbalum TaxID=1806994 RepID=A0A507CDK2_9FUNG|nr:uncharacterized protein SmJEL517_g00476 [Synchytrium microbalum]TPX37581.1 hypothetical protein SmJEL517_g00476 [Synchytrium microbalum]
MCSLTTQDSSESILHDDGPFLPPLDLFASRILSFLQPNEVLRLRSVSPAFNRECTSSTLWKYFNVVHGTLNKSPELVERMLQDGRSWMDVWRVVIQLDQVWKRGEFERVECLNGDDFITRMMAGSDFAVVNSHNAKQLSLLQLPPTQDLIQFAENDGVVLSMAMLGTRLVVGTHPGTLYLHNLFNGQILCQYPQAHKSGISSLTVNAKMILSCGFDGMIHVWKLAHKRSVESSRQDIEKQPISGRKKWLKHVIERLGNPSSSQVSPVSPLSGSPSNSEQVPAKRRRFRRFRWSYNMKFQNPKNDDSMQEAYALELVKSMPFADEDLYSITSLASGLVCTGGTSGIVKIWKISSGTCIRQCRGHSDAITSLALSSSTSVLSGSMDSTIREWDINSTDCLRTFQGHQQWIKTISTVGSWLVSGGYDEVLRIWSLNTLSNATTVVPSHSVKLNGGPIVTIQAQFEHIVVVTTKDRRSQVTLLDFAGPLLTKEAFTISKQPAAGDVSSDDDLWLDADEEFDNSQELLC